MSFSQSDQDLIAAAKAAGIKLTHVLVGGEPMSFSVGADGGLLGPWNPLEDDGDAFRLAAALKLNVLQGDFSVGVNNEADVDDAALVRNDDERLFVLRRAIVRAAAQIGRKLRKAASGSPLNARSD